MGASHFPGKHLVIALGREGRRMDQLALEERSPKTLLKKQKVQIYGIFEKAVLW